MDLHDIQAIREDGARVADLDEAIFGLPHRYVLTAHELYANGSTGELIQDPEVVGEIGRKMQIGMSTDPLGWGVWEVPA